MFLKQNLFVPDYIIITYSFLHKIYNITQSYEQIKYLESYLNKNLIWNTRIYSTNAKVAKIIH